MEVLLAGLLEHIVPILITVISGVLLTLIRGAIKKYGAKLDIETQARAEALLSDLVQQGVTYAEQWAKNESKRQNAVGGSAKLSKAMEYIAQEIERNKLPELAESVLVNKIEAALGFGTLNENHGEPVALVGEPVEEDDDADEYPTGA
jgi:hypothetical protein